MRLTNIWLTFFTGVILLSGCGGGGGSGTSDTTNLAPFANAGLDRSVMVNETITITGSGSDSDGTIVNYQWKEGSLILANTAEFNYTPTTVGTHTLTFTVTDNDGATDSDQMNVNVTEAKKLPLVIIRVEFDNYQFSSSASVWSQKIFGSNEGQVNHYYNEISYGKFQFQMANEIDGSADGVITVHLDENHPDDLEEKIDRLVTAAILADSSIDFSEYDTNKNGSISSDELQIMFLIAGGELATGAHPGIWAHSWCMFGSNASAPTLDGVRLMNCNNNGTYSAFGEKHFDASNGNEATIGIIAHELGHAVFDLPDLYDTEYNSAGIGNFGLMGGGSWAKKDEDSYYGQTPVHMTGWTKVRCNFTSATKLENDIMDIEVKATSSNDYSLYQIPTGRDGEYFLIENRDASGYDRGLDSLQGTGSYKGGLSILHIDDNLLNDCLSKNNCNDNPDHKLVDVEEANNILRLDTDSSYEGHNDNLFFAEKVDSFTPDTDPNSDTYANGSSGVSVTNISTAGATMTLDVEIN
ncbi:MAG TPA: M6 family metalloprotease domain-containing protein [Sulfurovum sp.]